MVQTSAPQILVSMAAVQEALSGTGIAKTRNNQQQGFKFRGIDDALNALSGLFAEQKIVVLPRTRERIVEARVTRKGDPVYDVAVWMEYHFTSAIDGSEVVADMWGEAMDQGDKATGKAKSMAYKELMFQTFTIPLEGAPEDRDADYTTHEPTTTRQPATRERAEPAKQEAVEYGTDASIEEAIRGMTQNEKARQKLTELLLKAYSVMTLDQIPEDKVQEAILQAKTCLEQQRRAAKK